MLLIRAPGARIWVEEGGNGVPVILLHGGTGTADHDWAPVLQHLRERYRVITMDMRGHGRSEDPDVQLGVDRFGLDVVQVMRHMGVPRAVLIGFSVGANTLLKLVSARPGIALGLVTIGASVAGDASRVPHILAGPWPRDLTSLHHQVGDGPDYWQRLRVALANDWANNFALTDERLQQISCPTLVCQGDHDRVASLADALHLHRTIPHSRLFVAPGAGHQLQLERPRLFVEAVDSFVTELDISRRACSA